MRKWIIALCIAAAVPFGLLVGSEFVDAQLTWRIPVKSGLTVGGLIHAKDRSNLSSLPAVATGQVLTSAGVATVPAWSATPTITSWTLSGLTASKPVFTDAAKLLVSTGTLGADQGGTGLATYAVGDIPYASAATTISKLADVAAGSYLRSGGVTTAPLWSTLTLPNAATAGDLIVATGTNAIGSIVDVAVGQVLVSGGVGVVPAFSGAPTGLTSLSAGTLTATTSATVGSGGTALTRAKVLIQGINPTASTAAIGVNAVVVSISGFTPSDVIHVVPPAQTALCPLVSARVTGTDEISLDYAVLTAAVCTGASGSYEILAIRS